MEMLVIALGPAFATGFALQRLLELLDPLFEKYTQDYKKIILNLLSLVGGLALAFGAGLRVLVHLGFIGPDFWDALVTSLIISAGTEGINTIMKYFGYVKQKEQAEAAQKHLEVEKKPGGEEAISNMK
jgi:hypothetical protein